MRPKVWLVVAAGLAALFVSNFAPSRAQAPDRPKTYIYVLHLKPRLYEASAWTAADDQAVKAHFNRLQAATAAGKVILAGRTDEPFSQTFGIVVFEAEGEDAARRFMLADPAVIAGVMVADLHPYELALLRR